jgi:hypothetical protein
MSDTFQIIGGYDLRRNTSTIAARDAHAMVKESNKRAGITKPRKPKAHTLDEILDRALNMGVKVEMSSKQFTFYPPKFDADGNQDGHNYGQYSIATKATAWQALDEIALEIVKSKSDEAISTEAEQAISDLLPPVVTIEPTVAEQAYQELQPVVDQWELDRAERIAAQGELTADDFRSTYEPRDNFGDNDFVFSARYGEMALI